MFSSFSSPFVHQIFSSFTSSVFLPFSKKSKDKAEFEKFTFCCYTCLSLNLKDVSEKLITHGFLHPFLLTPLWGPVQLLTPWVGGVRVERLFLFVLADRHQPASHQVAPPGVHLEQAVKKDWAGLNRVKNQTSSPLGYTLNTMDCSSCKKAMVPGGQCLRSFSRPCLEEIVVGGLQEKGGVERGVSTGVLVYWDVVNPRAATWGEEIQKMLKSRKWTRVHLPHRVVSSSHWFSHCERCVKVVRNMWRTCG